MNIMDGGQDEWGGWAKSIRGVDKINRKRAQYV